MWESQRFSPWYPRPTLKLQIIILPPVSYTHLDVYKRQALSPACLTAEREAYSRELMTLSWTRSETRVRFISVNLSPENLNGAAKRQHHFFILFQLSYSPERTRSTGLRVG